MALDMGTTIFIMSLNFLLLGMETLSVKGSKLHFNEPITPQQSVRTNPGAFVFIEPPASLPGRSAPTATP